jgi:hypothetical protein
VYNSEPTLERYLQAGLRRQTSDYGLRLVDNRAGRFSSAAAALNEGARGVDTDYLVFVHQDVELLRDDFFRVAGAHLAQTPNLGVAGIVGALGEGSKARLVGRCVQGNADAKGFDPGYDRPLRVQTVDEMLLLVERAWFERLKFDPSACPGWDLYGVEYALSCAKLGREVVVMPLAVRHASWGKLRRSYFQSLASVQSKHHDVPMLHTTCGTWPKARSAWRHWATHKANAARKLAFKRWREFVGS